MVVGRETRERLEAASEVVGVHEFQEMAAQLIVAVVVIPLFGRVFNRAVHALDQAVGPRVIGFCQSAFDAVNLSDHVEAHRSRIDRVSVFCG